jgi:Xaa-Pro aminopeptidase
MPTEVLADEPALRAARRGRALAQMDAHDIDVLVLGREANARYVTGATRLWTAGTRPFGPGCVLVRATGAMYLVSTWDEGIPDDIPHENLFGITWNPGKLLAWLRGIDGAAEARRVGTDSQTPRFTQLLPKVFPNASIVDAQPFLDAARRIKTAEEIVAIRASCRVAEAGLDAAVAGLHDGTTERELAGVFMDAMASDGVTTPATQRVAWITTRPSDGVVRDGDLVAFDAGVVAAGYMGRVARTWPVGRVDAAPFRQAGALWYSLLAACRPGASASDLLDVYGIPPSMPVACGLGLGFDVPVVTGDLPLTAAAETLEAGMVLALTAVEGPVIRTDAVLITDDGPEVLTSSPHYE